jgi:hypothetical protein
MKKYGKFAALVVIVLGAMVWLAFSGSSDSKSYYKTISELGKMGDQAHVKRVQAESGLHRQRAASRHLPGRRASLGRRKNGPGRRLPRHPDSGQMCLKI